MKCDQKFDDSLDYDNIVEILAHMLKRHCEPYNSIITHYRDSFVEEKVNTLSSKNISSLNKNTYHLLYLVSVLAMIPYMH
jgi:hypothetical protein